MNSKLKIAIDGPAASGKSTTARMVAKKLNYLYIDTGAMYRAITLTAIKSKVDINDEPALVLLAANASIELQVAIDGVITILNGVDISEEIRLPKVTKVISVISAHKKLRRKMVEKQRFMARHGGVVMEGRDIGTHVLPDAEIKVFMIAGLKERALRRHVELKKKGIEISLEEIEADIQRRDDLDSSRATAPLKPAKDAVHIDTSLLSIDEQVARVLKLVDDFNKKHQ
jgi:cytidylate kinase